MRSRGTGLYGTHVFHDTFANLVLLSSSQGTSVTKGDQIQTKRVS